VGRPAVGGLILAGLAIGVVFLWIESRAADPIVPLELFRIRNFSVSFAAMFLAAFGFFGADHLPAPLVPDGRRRQRHGIGLQHPAAAVGLIFSATPPARSSPAPVTTRR
jgi:hypothetical protein